MKYRVTVKRTTVSYATVEVENDNQPEAEDQATEWANRPEDFGPIDFVVEDERDEIFAAGPVVRYKVGTHTVRVWQGSEFVEGPDTHEEGWFWCGEFPEEERGPTEGDPNGPFETEEEATASAKDSAADWPDA